jgi:hypothetical protein
MRKIWAMLVVLLFLAGCIEQRPPTTRREYRNDVITLEQYSARPLNPDIGQPVKITFLVQNNGDREVDVTVNFFDLPGFTNIRLTCEEQFGQERSIVGPPRCEMRDVRPLGEVGSVRRVSLNMSAPQEPGEFTISYSVEYGHVGYREAHIPILPEAQTEPRFVRFRQSNPSWGPIRLDIEPPIGRERVVDERVIREYWIMAGESFKLRLKFIHVGSGWVGKVRPVNIAWENIEMRWLGEMVAEEDCYPSSIAVPGDRTEIICYLTAPTEDVETVGIVGVQFGYEYKYIRTETFAVQPSPRG